MAGPAEVAGAPFYELGPEQVLDAIDDIRERFANAGMTRPARESIATRIEESFFVRMAIAGGSSIATTSAAGCRRRREPNSAVELPSRGRIASSRPTRTALASGCERRKESAAGTVTTGP